MATFLYKLGRFSFRHRWYVVVAWLVLLVGIGTAASSVSGTPEEDFALPGTESQQALDLIEEAGLQGTGDTVTARLVFQAPEGESISSGGYADAVSEMVTAIEAGDEVTAVTDPFESGGISEDDRTGYLSVDYSATWDEITEEMYDQLFDARAIGQDAGLTVEAAGEVAAGPQDFGSGEIIGILVAAVVLIITFGSLVAAGVPLFTALLGVMIGTMGITALSMTLGLSETTGILATMIGLAVGIDYALFIASRYRSELVAGHSREEAIGRAAGTAGSAVVFAGLTVVIALSGLAIVNIGPLTKMGLAAAATVVIAVLVALTLVPAVLRLVGKRIFGRKIRKANPETGVPVELPTTFGKAGGPNRGSRWAQAVLRRPAMALIAAVVALGALAFPVSDMQLAMPDDSSQPEESTQHRAYDLLADGFGAGFSGPLMLVADAREADDPQAAADAIMERVDAHEEIIMVTPPTFSETESVATMLAFPVSGPASEETADLVDELRQDLSPELLAETGADMLVTGTTAINGDFSQILADALVPYLALVVGLAFLLLMIVFRSVLVPLKAALGFLFSVLAALGSVVAVFQWGWGAEIFGAGSGPIMSMMPIFMIGVIFGLAMDYEVFLVTRMREAHVHGESSQQSIVTGFNLNARVVTAAAIIMVSVFAGFITMSDSMVKMMGFGLAMAILLDAFIVRMVIVPAVMGLLGERAWWLPKWLDRILPNVDVEGESLERYLTSSGRGREAVQKDREPAPVG